MVRFACPAGVLAVAVVLLAGCTGPATPSASAGAGSIQAATGGTASASSGPGASQGAASGEPASPSAAPGSSGQPTVPANPGETPGSAAAACSGSHDNRVFFAAIAGQVTWTVYCAVLPAGWFVDTGSFSLRDGGRMEITYKGPNGARFTLDEGNVCTAGASACGPRNSDLGAARFGDRSGSLVTTDGSGGLALYIDPGGFPAWTALGTGLDQPTFTSFAASLVPVAG
jgi:hypothetical protein